jgi:hypothetical protein
VGGQRAEGVEHQRPPRRPRPARGPHRLGRAQAQWADLLRPRHDAAGVVRRCASSRVRPSSTRST